jgi:hypothetical protein
MKKNMFAYFVEHAHLETTMEDIKDTFDREFGGDFVSRVEESITVDYKNYWKSFTVYFNDHCVDKLFSKNMRFHSFMDRYILYYNKHSFWNVYLIKVMH